MSYKMSYKMLYKMSYKVSMVIAFLRTGLNGFYILDDKSYYVIRYLDPQMSGP